jgi:exopolysaccharide biosynthesis polyprenyl glycosylphosphotransferase
MSATQPVSHVAPIALPIDRPVRGPRREHGWRAAGFALLAVAAWTPLGLGGTHGAIAAAVLVLLSVALLEVATHEMGEYAAFSVRGARFILAAVLLAPLAAEALTLGGSHPGVPRTAAALVGLVAGATVWDALCRSARMRKPLRLLVVGNGQSAGRLAMSFNRERPAGFELAGFLATEREGCISARPLLGAVDDIAVAAVRERVDAIVLAAPTGRLEVLEAVVAMGGRAPAVLELSELYERAFGRVPVGEINAAWFLRAQATSRRSALVVPKRIVDVVISTLAMVLLAPLFLLVALAIKLDSPGPVLYRQQRVGEHGRRFTMLKFRSMIDEAERDGLAVWACEDDPRITRVGRVLRRFRCDELPQLWNVLRGQMTLVGPRPERPELVSELTREVPYYDSRHLARPGITGWAQVYAPYGASVDDALRKLSYDLYYLKHCSISTDFGIMLRTASVMIGGRGAR